VDLIAGDFAARVRHGLSLTPKRLDPQFFYDALGSALFDAITCLPEYTITRAETALLRQHGREMVGALAGAPQLVELGPGNGEKLDLLLGSARDFTSVHLIDISAAALGSATARLREGRGVEVTCYQGAFLDGLAALPHVTRRRLVLFLGSNLGNFSREEAGAFLSSVRASLSQGDGLLLGVDLIKLPEVLLAAYDDALGVTAAFNKNLLARMNRELGANFDLLAFDHRAIWNPGASRIEMHLVSIIDQEVRFEPLDLQVSFAAGESIWTESSHKYSSATLRLSPRRAASGTLRSGSTRNINSSTRSSWPIAENHRSTGAFQP
jgi:dimethylhistidine N-methyltransferase